MKYEADIAGRVMRRDTLKEMSELYCAIRDVRYAGSSKFPRARVKDQSGKTVAFISYNGKVWRGSPEKFNDATDCLYSPYETEAA